MVVERHVRLNSPPCEPFQYEPHRHERRPQIAAAFLLHRILVQTAERVDQDQSADTDQPQQITMTAPPLRRIDLRFNS
jgi:hypothetical protein